MRKLLSVGIYLGVIFSPGYLLPVPLLLLCCCSAVLLPKVRADTLAARGGGGGGTTRSETAFDLTSHLGNLSPYRKVPVPHGFKEDLPDDCVVEQVTLVRYFHF